MNKFLLVTGALVISIVLLSTVDSKAENVIKWKSSQEESSTMSKVEKKQMADKVGWMLADLYDEHQAYLAKGTEKAFTSSYTSLQISDDLVVIDAIASGDVEKLRSDLEELGMQDIAVFGRVVSGRIPIGAIDDMAQLDSLQFAKASISSTNAGQCTSEGDVAMRSDVARDTFGVDGSGVSVGVMSDSYDCLGGAAADVATGDLPPGISVLEEGDCANGIDEGRAMMQLTYDVAPGANLVYQTANFGQANFAQGIIDLANAGANVIVDDIYYFAEPMFQDGIIAQAVDTVVGMGVAYFSAAGNFGRNSYQSSFNPSGQNFMLDIKGVECEAHDFDPGPGVDVLQSITIPEGATFNLTFQWDSPFFSVSGPPGSPNDLDILLLDSTGTTTMGIPGIVANVGGDAVEVITFENPEGSGASNFNLLIGNCGGPNPELIKYIIFNPQSGMTINEYDTQSSTVFGHINASGAEAVGAAFFLDTPEFGTSPPILESSSSAGGTPILFDPSGNPLESSVIRMKPQIVAPDGTGTTFFGIPVGDMSCPFHFFGTSAAAPHAAGVAALMLESMPPLTPSEIYDAMEISAISMNPNPRIIAAKEDMGTAGLDFNPDTGFGFIQADAAIQQLSPTPIPTSTPTPTPTATPSPAPTPTPTPSPSPTPTPTPTPTPSPTPTPTGGGGGNFGSKGSCTTIAGAAPVQLGTAMANILIPLIPAVAIGFRMIRRRKKKAV